MIVKYQDISSVVDVEKGYTEDYIKEHISEIIYTIDSISKKLKQVPLPNKQYATLDIEIAYDEELITLLLIDAIEDLKRIHDFHPIENSNSIKEAAYIGYWWQRRKPVRVNGSIASIDINGLTEDQIKKIKAKFMFINEVCIAYYMRPKIFDLVKSPSKRCNTVKHKDEWNKATDHLIYFLAYRAENPKSVEEMLLHSTLHPIWSTKQDFWNI